MRSDAARLVRAYRATGYEAAGLVVLPGRRSAAAAALLARLGTREAGFVTAWNPGSRRRPQGWNRRMQRAFLAATRRLPRLAGHGRGRGWAEQHLLIGADRRRLVRLARRFRQRAIVLLGRGGRARLVWL
jgi:hypothetical protein